MNAPVKPPLVLGDIDDFVECCADHAWFFAEGWISLQTAADNLHRLAELWDLIDEVGHDRIQEIIAGPIRRVREQANGGI